MAGINYRFITMAIALLTFISAISSIVSLVYTPFEGWDLEEFHDEDKETFIRRIVVHALTILSALLAVPVTSSSMHVNGQRKMMLLPLVCSFIAWIASSCYDIVAMIRQTKMVDEKWADYIVIVMLVIGSFLKFLYIIALMYYFDYLRLFTQAPKTIQATQRPITWRDSKMPIGHVDLKRLTFPNRESMDDELTKLFSKEIGLGFPFLSKRRLSSTSLTSNQSNKRMSTKLGTNMATIAEHS
eukprot:TCONS_00065739-protein